MPKPRSPSPGRCERAQPSPRRTPRDRVVCKAARSTDGLPGDSGVFGLGGVPRRRAPARASRRRTVRDAEPDAASPEGRAQIAIALSSYADRRGGQVFTAPLDIVFAQREVAEPDVLYIAHENVEIIGEKAILGVPNLVVEVLSPSTCAIDRGIKRDLYARYGVAEYWVVDLNAKTIDRYAEPNDGRYADVATFHNRMSSATLSDLTVSICEVMK